MSNQLTNYKENEIQTQGVFNSMTNFENAQRIAGALIKSSLVPVTYKDNLPNALIALEMATRINASPLSVMQNLHVIEGRPSWSSAFILAALNSSGKFSPVRFEMKDLGKKQISYDEWVGPKEARKKIAKTKEINNISCTAFAIEKATGDRLDGPAVTMEMAVDEGWYGKTGSKWKTMPELMLRYRAAAFFGRLYAPEILMGMHTEDEVIDIEASEAKIVEVTPEIVVPETKEEAPKKKRSSKKEPVEVVDVLKDVDNKKEDTNEKEDETGSNSVPFDEHKASNETLNSDEIESMSDIDYEGDDFEEIG